MSEVGQKKSTQKKITFLTTLYLYYFIKKKLSERQTKAGNQDFCKTCTLSFTHSGHAEKLLFSCLCSKVIITFSHSFSLSLTLSISHSLTLNMLNNFCFHVYAQKSLIISEIGNVYFLTSASSPDPLTLEFMELVPSY